MNQNAVVNAIKVSQEYADDLVAKKLISDGETYLRTFISFLCGYLGEGNPEIGKALKDVLTGSYVV